MITVLTGQPGSCKTLYTVDKLLQAILKTTIKHTDADGVETDIPRRIFTNINGLLLDHEKLDPGAPWVWLPIKDHPEGGKWTQDPSGNKLGLNNWHEWAKPGDVIVPDEVQKIWPLCATGSKVPPCIEALETHRHMGVDFIVMTQHPMMIHVNITRLAGRHLHMRRLGNMGFATVYEWDGVSRTLLYKNAMAKFAYRFNKKAFALYKSAELHTKQPRRLPSLIFGVALAVLGMATIGPMAYARLTERLNPPEVAVVVPPASSVAPAATLTKPQAPTPAESPLAPPVASRDVSGCIASAARCTCFDVAGKIIPTDPGVCRAGSVTAGLYLRPPAIH